MTTRQICIAGYDKGLLVELKEQIKCYFDNHISYLLWDYNEHQSMQVDGIILVFSVTEYNYALTQAKGIYTVILGKLALTVEAHKTLSHLAKEGTISLLHHHRELATDYLQHLYAYNFPCAIKAASWKDLPAAPDALCAPATIAAKYTCDSRVSIFDGFLIDRTTMIELGFAMDMDDLIYPQDLLNQYRPIKSPNPVLSEMITRNHQFDEELKLLEQIMDQAMVAVNSEGVVQICNQLACDLLNCDRKLVTGQKAPLPFRMLNFSKVLKTRKPIRDQLLEVAGQDLIVSIKPIERNRQCEGAVAMIREFHEEEIKQHQIRKQLIAKGHHIKYRFNDLIGDSEAVEQLKVVALRMSKSDDAVLIHGESGTGKELVAQAMHSTSPRSKHQFVAFNCGALPESLLESELFGYEEGAFTGARKGGKAGLFELAHKGTLFLDEIGEMPMSTQLRFLRVLQEREVMRIGSDRLVSVDVRIIAASNKNLKQLVAIGDFREDLYYRLNVLPLKVPPLRRRGNDVMLLIQHFQAAKDVELKFSAEAIGELKKYNWPGNIRELGNYVAYWANLDKELIERADLPFLEDEEFGSSVDTTVDISKENQIFAPGSSDIPVLTFILDSLQTAKNEGQIIGRRNLYLSARASGHVISEHGVRHLLLQLDGCGYVKIMKGRGGTVITPQGTQFLEKFRKIQ